jgi:hypothetical protein
VADDLARTGARQGAPRRTDEPLTAYGRRLGRVLPGHAGEIEEVTLLVERAVYGGIEPSAEQIGAALATSRRLRGLRRRRNAGTAQAPPGQPAERASASSKDAPAASRGR